MIHLYITRHGKTVMNQNRQFQGTSDSPLIEEGLVATQELAQRLKNVTFIKAYCSPLGRARQTANILLANHGIDPNICDGLIELDFGDFEGKNIEASREEYQDLFDIFFKQPHRFQSVMGIESIEEFHHRVDSSLRQIVKSEKQGNILIVCHGIVVRSMIMSALNRPMNDFWIDGHIPGASLTTITYENGRFDVVSRCDTSHMSHIPTD